MFVEEFFYTEGRHICAGQVAEHVCGESRSKAGGALGWKQGWALGTGPH